MRRRRIQAVLAAGLVVGVGTASTIAAWTDTERATGAFSASVFDTQSQTAGSPVYASHTDNAATLTFSDGALSPGVARYAWINVRTTAASTVGGTVTPTRTVWSDPGPLVGPPHLASALEYRIVRLAGAAPAAACGASAFTGSPVFVAGGPTTHLAVTVEQPVGAVASPIGPAQSVVGFCVEVRLRSDAATTLQGRSATVEWTFTGTSAE